jgi:hypothetical protein
MILLSPFIQTSKNNSGEARSTFAIALSTYPFGRGVDDSAGSEPGDGLARGIILENKKGRSKRPFFAADTGIGCIALSANYSLIICACR